jgi:hypothetical protein
VCGSDVAKDLVLLDQQSVGKGSLRMMDTVNAKKRRTTIYWRVNNFEKEPHSVPRCLKSASLLFLKINDINNITVFGTPDSHHSGSIA